MIERAARSLYGRGQPWALLAAWTLSGLMACSSGLGPIGVGLGSPPSTAEEAQCDLFATGSDAADLRSELSFVDCLLTSRRLDEAASRLAAIVARIESDDPLKEQVSERLMRLLHIPGQLSGLPAQLRLSPSSIPLPAVEARIANHTGLLFLDSGAEVTILRDSVCSDLDLERGAGGVAENAGGDVVGGIYTAQLPHELVLGSAKLTLPVVVCADLDNFSEVEPRILGVLGANALGAASYHLNMARGELALGAPLPETLVRLDANFQDGRVYVTVSVDGVPVRFLLDTGADSGEFAASTAQDLNLSVRSGGESRTSYLFGGTQEESGARVTVGRLRSGDEQREDVDFRVAAKNRLGVDFLEERTLVVDRAAGVVGLSP